MTLSYDLDRLFARASEFGMPTISGCGQLHLNIRLLNRSRYSAACWRDPRRHLLRVRWEAIIGARADQISMGNCRLEIAKRTHEAAAPHQHRSPLLVLRTPTQMHHAFRATRVTEGSTSFDETFGEPAIQNTAQVGFAISTQSEPRLGSRTSVASSASTTIRNGFCNGADLPLTAKDVRKDGQGEVAASAGAFSNTPKKTASSARTRRKLKVRIDYMSSVKPTKR